MNQPDLETRSLKLLTEIHAELRDALNGLGGRTYEGAREAYRFHTAAHLNHAVEGYIYLRQGRRLDASKHLVRNAIEMLILLMAVQKKPELLFRIALNEHNDKKTQVRCMAHGDVSAALSAIDKQWSDFKSAYQTKYPEQQLVETQLSLRDIAQHAGIQSYYDTHYRLYCRFTHAALEATIGSLNEFDGEDNRTMACCALSGVEALSSIGAPTPNLESLRERLKNLT